ncbi:unnamed protein product [Taenia asiatica]|uniref:Radial spoke head protein 4 A n=1 Tax=Taenia asiatica TaxID=60517 RepID=A0A0R3W4H8_TAEAS|nr:unnamed protein product [Taenia asiatica]
MGEILPEDIVKCKEKLKKCCGSSGISSYDALKSCLRNLISGECKDIQDLADFFRDVLNGATENNDKQTEDVDLEYLIEEKAIFSRFIKESEPKDEGIVVQDLCSTSSMFKCTGEGLSTSEFFKIQLAIKKIIADYPVESIRFWGKIFGIHNDYYIIECTPGDSDVFEDNVKKDLVQEETESNDWKPVEAAPNFFNILIGFYNIRADPSLPKSIWKPYPETPPEEVGKGVNSRVYFVSNFPCGPYSRLPHAEPKQIVVSRLIYSPFTGDLTASVASFPPFPGTEAHYLRAQIARISAATQLAPQNFYHLRLESDDDGEDEEGNEEVVQVECEENEEYVAQPLDEMDLEQWVHCRPYILPQGRVNWWNPLEAENVTESDANSSDDGNTVPPLRGLGVEPQPERGPPILTPIAEDLEVQGQIPWTIRRYPGGPYLRVSSVLWPGAHTVAQEGWVSLHSRGFLIRFLCASFDVMSVMSFIRKDNKSTPFKMGKRSEACGAFENIYVGWGLKATGPAGFQTTLPAVQCETLEEPAEQADPTPEEEAANEEEKGRGDEEDSDSDGDDDDDGKEEEEEED